MFSLKWLTGAGRQVLYWISGAAALTILYRIFDSYMKSRAVRKSEGQAQKDSIVLSDMADQVEKGWAAQGEKIDKQKDST